MNPADFPVVLTGGGRIDVSDEGCWLRTVRILRTGYSLTGRHGRDQRLAHRAMYEIVHGLINEGMQIDHLCHTLAGPLCVPPCQHRRCINPDHLEAVTHTENQRRSPFTPAGRTHCPQGHPYDAANTTHSGGRRHCRACGRKRALADSAA